MIQVLEMARNQTYNLDGKRKPHQRVWNAPISTLLRYQYATRQLDKHVTREGNTVRIQPYPDELHTDRTFPSSEYLTQDLHGVTLYVPDSDAARVFVGDREVRSLTRNAADFTGRQSVTIIDTHWPKSVFDEVDFYERAGRVFRSGAMYQFLMSNPYAGQYAMKVTALKDGDANIHWEPFLCDSHETGFFRFAYKKTNPNACVELTWELENGAAFTVTDDDLAGRQGWKIPHRTDTDYHEVIVSFYDFQGPKGENKQVPRGGIRKIAFGLSKAQPGDAVYYDRVEFLAARGIRPTKDGNVVIGGRIIPAEDGIPIELTVPSKDGASWVSRTMKTTRGGWYWFTGVPVDARIRIVARKAGRLFYPARGLVTQAVRNDMEYNIYTRDECCNSIPRGREFITNKVVTSEMGSRMTMPSEDVKEKYGSRVAPHSVVFYAGHIKRPLQYISEFQASNIGLYDKDRTESNEDKAYRILLLGECWTENLQTPLAQHYSVLLESMLRDATGRNVEVIPYATSNATIGTNAEAFEKLVDRFRPDLTVLMSNFYTTVTINGRINQDIVGWDAQHGPYRVYDFQPDGSLTFYPPTPNYAVYMHKPVAPEEGKMPLLVSLLRKGDLIPEAQKAMDLFEAVLKNVYLKRVQPHGGNVAIVYGYSPDIWGDMTFADGERSYQAFADRMQTAAKRAGVLPVDVRQAMQNLLREITPLSNQTLCWEQDLHLSPFGSYIMARSLCEGLTPLLANSRATQGDSASARKTE
ncbi:MAG: hypothetical protein JW849_04465 [Phycisphaerae bacterium]|nr:hypothetical protein [Phycisphaerae bacterium]